MSAPLPLSDLRAQAGRTQAQIADTVHTSQSGVSRIERQRDILISTLRDFVEATGGRLHVVATYPDYEREIHIPVLHDKPRMVEPSRAFKVVWQNRSSRRLVQVGLLEYDGASFTYSYTADARLDPDFVPFSAFRDLARRYRSTTLFPFFTDRLASSAVGGTEQLAKALGLVGSQATPVELLARSWGHSPHDTIQVVPDPVTSPDGSEVMLFLASGVRHVMEGSPKRTMARITRLRVDDELRLREEPENPENDRAIVLDASTGPVGWVPDYLLDYVYKHRDGGKRVSASVVQANGEDLPWHLRLLCRLKVGA